MRRDMSSMRLFAHPSLLSATVMTVSVSSKASEIFGSCLTYCSSTEYPTPVPHNKTYMASSKDLGLSTGRYAQLYAATLHLSIAAPAVIKARILGITSRL